MASIVGCEVEIQDECDVQIQEVEVGPIPVEMPIETVETTEETTMIALQPLPEPAQEEIVLHTSGEEVVGDPNFVYVDNIPVPAPEIVVSTQDTIPITYKKGKGGKKKGKGRGQIVDTGLNELTLDTSGTTRKWEQKQVQIRTLEGEFSVTMWASGE